MRSEQDAFTRFVDVVSHTLDNPDWDMKDLAVHVHLSRSQFDRIVTAVAGESPGRFRRRILLERSAFRLVTEHANILDIAIEAGYSSHEAFTRAFQRSFGVTPSEWRIDPGNSRLPTPNGVHFHPPGGLRLPARAKVASMELLVAMTEHHIEVVSRLIEGSARLAPDVLDQPIAAYTGSLGNQATLRTLLSRLVGQLDMWNQSVANRPYDFDQEVDESLASMQARLDQCGPMFLEGVRSACDSDTLGDTFVDATTGTPYLFTYAGMIAHVITYAAYRRTLAVEVMEAAGITDLADDPLDWAAFSPSS